MTSGDILNFSLSIGFILIAIFLSITLFYIVFILRDLSQAVNKLKKTAEFIDKTIRQPLKITQQILLKSKFLNEWLKERSSNRKKS